MKIRLGINGCGRIGRNLTRISHLSEDFQLVAINELNPNKANLAYLLKYDSTLGRFPGNVDINGDYLLLGNEEIRLYHEADIAAVPWDEAGVDVVIDCTGVLEHVEQTRQLIANNAFKKAVFTYMSPDVDNVIIMGTNENSYNSENQHVLSSSICDANAIGPVLKRLHQTYDIQAGSVTTLHPWLSYQKLVDAPIHSQSNPGHYWDDFRLGRASIGALIPKDTTAVSAFLRVMPELEGKLDAISYRVPTHVVSSADITLHVGQALTAESLTKTIHELAEQVPFVTLNKEQLISVDFEQTSASCIIDMQFVRVIGSNMIKLVLWYDNEWGYSHRALDVARLAVS